MYLVPTATALGVIGSQDGDWKLGFYGQVALQASSVVAVPYCTAHAGSGAAGRGWRMGPPGLAGGGAAYLLFSASREARAATGCNAHALRVGEPQGDVPVELRGCRLRPGRAARGRLAVGGSLVQQHLRRDGPRLGLRPSDGREGAPLLTRELSRAFPGLSWSL